ncbi:tyrosine-type recombinase/integrase [Bacteroides sp.]
MKKQVSLTRFMASVIANFEAEGKWSTAHVYAATLRAVTAFAGGGEVFFSALTPVWLKKFETYLRDKRQVQWNTVSTYMRMLRATYNRAVSAGLTRFIPGLFDNVYTGVKRERKIALSRQDMYQLIYAPPRQSLTPEVEQSREWLRMMFQLQGMPFVDLAHLHHSDFDTGKRLLTCHRQKTGKPLEVNLSVPMMKWIEQNRNPDKVTSPYLFDILNNNLTDKESYKEYQRLLRRLNHHLKTLARIQGVKAKISSYTARHTWATLAKHCGIPEGLICDALGHGSVKTTETYLKSFDNSSLRRANSKIIEYVRHAVTV